MKIYTDTREGYTVIPNSFIDQYMPHANGEFVKVYLYLLRCADCGCELSLSSIADVFEHTEKDVRRALVYWERQNFLRMKISPDGTIESVTFTDPGSYSTPVIIADEVDESPGLFSDGMSAYQAPAYENRNPVGTPIAAHAAAQEAGSLLQNNDGYPSSAGGEAFAHQGEETDKARAELQELFLVAEQYLQRPLSSTEQDDFVYYYRTLHFSADLIEYLLEYCITRGKVSHFYMRKVAQSWAEAGISSVQEAKRETNLYNKNYFTIMKAFGIKGRNPAPPETEVMERWLSEYAFSLDIILEAARRTINQTHEPNFQYADKILEKWHRDGIHTIEDIEAADQKWEQEQAAKKNAQKSTQGRARTGTVNRFNNFTQREYDFENLEKKLYGQS